MCTAAVIAAAGQGMRVGVSDVPKQYRLIDGMPMLRHSIDTFARHGEISAIQVVIHPSHQANYASAAGSSAKLLPPVIGGAERQASVLAGLQALVPHGIDHVLIHDAARPFVDAKIIGRVLAALASRPAAIAAMPLADTLKREGSEGIIAATIARNSLWRAQTPQGFHFAAILEAHRRAAAAGRSDFTDDAAIAEWVGIEVGLVLGSESNRKITTADDMRAGQASMPAWPDIRTGSGFDVHRFTSGDHVMLAPPFIVEDEHLDAIVARLHEAIDAAVATS